MSGKTLSPHVTYWIGIASLLLAAVAYGAWLRMNDADKRKMMLGLR